ncbi:hypothetical protein [Pimelobacter simplex]|uniref:hypothetical protein n=1 Tax=Nocardioides simplex TaxID=2045 RepID=UPI001932AC31|nr:hypothetical protein [Pimelobacter simplex]
MPTVLRALSLALLALLLVPLTVVLAPPASAAPPFTVDSAADTPDSAPGDGTCATAANVCTLRAAMQEAAAWPTGDVLVYIDPAEVTTPIVLNSAISIPARTSVDGCAGASATQPCVTLSGVFGAAPVRLTGTGAALMNVAVVSDEESSVGVIMSGSDVHLSQVWVGMDTAGVASPLATGIWVTGTDVAIGQIGPQDPEFRTTIVNASTGIDIDGADNVAVNATNIGLDEDGLPTDPVHGGEVGILVASGDADVPDNVNIGNSLPPAAQATLACDNVCNAIGQMAEASIKVDLPNTAAAPMIYVRGNYLGLAADGTTIAAGATAVGVEAGRSSMQLGGDVASRNVIAGGAYGVRQAGAVGSVNVDHALVGTDATGTVAWAPTVAAISADGDYSGVSSSRLVTAPGTTAAVLTGDEGTVVGNVFGLLADGAAAPMAHAVRLVGDGADVGSADDAADRNVICSATGSGIVVAGGDGNLVRGNRIGLDETGSPCTGARANRAGVVVKDGADAATGNQVGGPVGGENTISHSLHNAITVAATGGNDAVHNLGTGNQGLMLDVGGLAAGTPDDGDGVGNPDGENGDVHVPQIHSATGAVIEGGGGGAGDYVYVYATDSPAGGAPSGVGAFLGEAQVSANGDGLWTFVPANPLAPGLRITAIAQSRQPNRVSEFSTVATVVATPGVPSGPVLTVAGNPLLKGRAKVGKRIKVVVPASAPAGAVVTVQWLVGKRALAGATKPVLRLRAGHLGKKVSARVTWTLPGSSPVVLATARVRVRR